MKAKDTTDCGVGYPVEYMETFLKSGELQLELVKGI